MSVTSEDWVFLEHEVREWDYILFESGRNQTEGNLEFHKVRGASAMINEDEATRIKCEFEMPRIVDKCQIIPKILKRVETKDGSVKYERVAVADLINSTKPEIFRNEEIYDWDHIMNHPRRSNAEGCKRYKELRGDRDSRASNDKAKKLLLAFEGPAMIINGKRVNPKIVKKCGTEPSTWYRRCTLEEIVKSIKQKRYVPKASSSEESSSDDSGEKSPEVARSGVTSTDAGLTGPMAMCIDNRSDLLVGDNAEEQNLDISTFLMEDESISPDMVSTIPPASVNVETLMSTNPTEDSSSSWFANLAIHEKLRNEIGQLQTAQACAKFYDSAVFQACIQEIRRAQDSFISDKLAEGKTPVEAREEWAWRWATSRSQHDDHAVFLDNCRKTALTLLYKVCDLCFTESDIEGLKWSDALQDTFKLRRIDEILIPCLVMDRFNALYNMTIRSTGELGLGWYSKYNATQYQESFGVPLNPRGNTINKRLWWLYQVPVYRDDSVVQNWMKPEIPARLMRR